MSISAHVLSITCPLNSTELGRLTFQGRITWITVTQMSEFFNDLKSRTVYQNICMSLSRQLGFHTEWQPQQCWSDTVLQDLKCACPREQARNCNTFYDPVWKVTQVSFPPHSIVQSSHKPIQVEGGRGTQTLQLDGMNAAIFGKQFGVCSYSKPESCVSFQEILISGFQSNTFGCPGNA